MTDKAGVATRHWAVLIGINFYVGERCLRGSVRDVETIKQHLEAGPTPVDIAILTATTPADPGFHRPIEEPELWPTSANLFNKLKRVLEKARRGDFVYIHYSGHGTRRKDERSTHPAGNLAFVLFEDNEHGSSYVMGKVLANCLRRMVERGLLVTLVLDCCHSGSVLRNGRVQGADVRAIDYNPAVAAASPQYPGLFGSDINTSTLRDAQMSREQWFINPDGYTILAACGPQERAWELTVEGGERRGALSYFLVEALGALRKSGVELTHQSLYQHLRTRFHASWPQQTPMRYGDENFSFFGKLHVGVAPSTGFSPVYWTEDGRLCLAAGEAHGVHKGDEYAVHPFDTPEEGVVASRPKSGASMAAVMVRVRVETVRCLTSDVVGFEEESATAVEQIRTGWKAEPVTHFSPRKTRVRLMAGVGSSRIPWTEAAKQQRFLHLCTEEAQDTEPCLFHVTLNEHSNKYEILDGSLERIVSLPAIPSDTPGRVMDVLQHLATFKYFEGVENRTPSPSFEGSFSLLPIHDGAEASGHSHVKHGDVSGFTVENLGDRPLYLAIFNFTPSWKIVNLVSQGGGGDFMVVEPKDHENLKDHNKAEVRMLMQVPEFLQVRGERRCEEVVKVFLTSKPTSFPSMALPELAETIERSVRGSDMDDQLFRFLLGLTTSFRGQHAAAREEWTSRNLIICTAME